MVESRARHLLGAKWKSCFSFKRLPVMSMSLWGDGNGFGKFGILGMECISFCRTLFLFSLSFQLFSLRLILPFTLACLVVLRHICITYTWFKQPPVISPIGDTIAFHLHFSI
jgi:hypothetical protein